jgi:hypothetical protein
VMKAKSTFPTSERQTSGVQRSVNTVRQHPLLPELQFYAKLPFSR